MEEPRSEYSQYQIELCGGGMDGLITEFPDEFIEECISTIVVKGYIYQITDELIRPNVYKGQCRGRL